MRKLIVFCTLLFICCLALSVFYIDRRTDRQLAQVRADLQRAWDIKSKEESTTSKEELHDAVRDTPAPVVRRLNLPGYNN